MNGRQPANHDVVTDRDVPRQRRVIGKNHVSSHNTVMSDMASDHEVAVVADYGFVDPDRGFPDFIVTCSRMTLFLPMMSLVGSPSNLRCWGRMAQGRERIDDRIRADCRIARDDNMRNKTHTRLKLYLRPDDAVGPDEDVIAELGAVFHNGGRMSFAHARSSCSS